MSIQTLMVAATATLWLASAPALAAETQATVRDPSGRALGTVTARDTASGRVVLTIELHGLPPGPRAVHLHQIGDCSAPDFASAGGHIAAGAVHGVDNPTGPHPGDLPNVFVGSTRSVHVEYFLTDVEVERDLLDGDGAAFVVHQAPDDYRTDPAGEAGTRIACAAFVRP
jgi:Cu-Zn family superoxide dismutase